MVKKRCANHETCMCDIKDNVVLKKAFSNKKVKKKLVKKPLVPKNDFKCYKKNK